MKKIRRIKKIIQKVYCRIFHEKTEEIEYLNYYNTDVYWRKRWNCKKNCIGKKKLKFPYEYNWFLKDNFWFLDQFKEIQDAKNKYAILRRDK